MVEQYNHKLPILNHAEEKKGLFKYSGFLVEATRVMSPNHQHPTKQLIYFRKQAQKKVLQKLSNKRYSKKNVKQKQLTKVKKKDAKKTEQIGKLSVDARDLGMMVLIASQI